MAYQITYEAYDAKNPADKGATTVRCGRIVNKRTLTIYDLVDRAIDHGNINAVKRNEAVAVLRSALDEAADAVKESYVVNLGKLRMQLNLKGQLGENDSIGPKNWVKTALTAGDEIKASMDELSFVNAQSSAKVSITAITTVGEKAAGTWIKNKNVTVTGANLAFDANIGDKVTTTYTAAGETHTTALVVKSSQYNSMELAWHEDLFYLAAGDVIEISFTLHGGNAEATPKTITKKVTMAA